METQLVTTTKFGNIRAFVDEAFIGALMSAAAYISLCWAHNGDYGWAIFLGIPALYVFVQFTYNAITGLNLGTVLRVTALLGTAIPYLWASGIIGGLI